MRLVDCFLDSILYTRQFLRALPQQSPEYDTVRDNVKL